MDPENEPAETLLRHYFEEPDPQVRERLASELLLVRAEPLIRKVTGRRLTSASPQDREDVRSDVLLSLFQRLAEMGSGGPGAIERFEAYVTVMAANACDQYYRKRFPQRHRLKNRVHYLVSTTRNYALWDDHQGRSVCGKLRDRGKPPVTLEAGFGTDISPARKTPAELLESVFRRAAGPLEFDRLVEVFARLWSVVDQQVSLDDEGGEAMLATHPDTEGAIDRERVLRQVWLEVKDLPAAQRVALLLNLRDEQGAPALRWLPVAGIASIRQIAQALDIPAEEFAILWNRLPLDDLEIAGRLGLTRQRVINLRLAAKQRLARRIEKRRVAAQ